jgi:pyroglutamyl-peptidase
VANLLLTGFEPFGSFDTNPSWDALVFARDSGLFAGVDVALARIPVVYATAFGALEAALAAHQPKAALSFGLHSGLKGREAATVYVETTARNRDGASKADNAGEARPERAIDARAPGTLAATLDTGAIVHALNSEGFSAVASDDAGAYLCNHLFFRGAQALQGRIPYGFVHVPPLDSQGGVLTLERLAHAVATIAHVIARPA